MEAKEKKEEGADLLRHWHVSHDFSFTPSQTQKKPESAVLIRKDDALLFTYYSVLATIYLIAACVIYVKVFKRGHDYGNS